ncbi:MAG TPA: FtsQ-type POTRA domain-containing protein [Candidatus Sulfotelmatobacter sp.]|nr:FtsQ-type POTRA domain-containing protein [Candidatus Sulfotelmatobacter sp.]
MARKSSGTILQEELYPSSAGHSHVQSAHDESPRPGLHDEELDDARLVDLDVNEESPFLRGQKRVSARRSSLPRKTASRLLWACVAAAILGVAAIAAAGLYEYGERSWRFRVDSSDNIEINGMQNVAKAQIMEVMGADIGRNIFFVPLAQQKALLEQIPWVESASVMRFVPNRLKVEIYERTPVAFARVGPRISLIDAGGTLMELPPKHKYSFPVILGMNPGEPLSTRAPRMKAYNELVRDLDSSGARYSQDLSEVDLSDLENLKVRTNDPAGDVLIELGSSDYLKRYQTYVSHAQQWRQQFQKLESVNLRYDNQVIVNPDMQGGSKQPALSASAAKAAAAAGVKPAALTTRLAPTSTVPHDRTLPKPAFELTEKKLDPKSAAAKKPVSKAKFNKTKSGSGSRAKKVAAKPSASVTKDGIAKAGVAKAAAATRPASAQKPEVTKPAPSAASSAAHVGIPKPSAAILKPQTNTSSN